MFKECTEVTAIFWMLQPFGEVGRNDPEYFSWEKDFQKLMQSKVTVKNLLKQTSWSVFAFADSYMGRDKKQPVFRGLRITQAQTSLRIRAV